MNNFVKRLLSSVVGFMLFIGILYCAQYTYAQPLVAFFFASLIVVAVREFYHLLSIKGVKPLSKMSTFFIFLYMAALFAAHKKAELFLLPWVVLFLALLSGFLYFFFKPNHSLMRLPATFFAFCYLLLPLGCALSILFYFPYSADGAWWLFYVVVLSKITDVGAYLVGKLIGRHSLAKSISPHKTIEGAAGGIVFALIASALLPYCVRFFSTSMQLPFFSAEIFLFVLLLSVLAQMGDLSESLLKRDAGVKDSSALPGLGGVLDVVDSLIFTLPLMYFYLLITYPR